MKHWPNYGMRRYVGTLQQETQPSPGKSPFIQWSNIQNRCSGGLQKWWKVRLWCCVIWFCFQMRHSNHKQVLLKRVGLNTSGTYRCEVTTKNLRKPGFDSQYDDGSLTVLGKTSLKLIEGLRATYPYEIVVKLPLSVYQVNGNQFSLPTVKSCLYWEKP